MKKRRPALWWKVILQFFEPTWRKLLGIVVLAYVARLIVYGFIRTPWIIFDEFIYLDTARQIIRGHFAALLSKDPQLYPPGWPLLFTAVSGFIKNPYLQYKIILLFNMLISSLVPVMVYLLVGSVTVSLLVAFYPPLFVYSSSIMSETFYIFMLFAVLTILKYIIKDDLRKSTSLMIAALVLAFFLYYTKLVRSFGIVLLPSFILSAAVVGYLQLRQGSRTTLKRLVYFTVLTVFGYYLLGYLAKLTIISGSFYNRTPYLQSLWQAILRPRFSFTLLRNQLTLSLFFWYFLLPIFFWQQLVKEWHKKEWHLLLPRIFAVFIYLSSLVLTFAHMSIGTNRNPQYLLLSRYLDPALVLLFVFGLKDFFEYLNTKTNRIKLSTAVYLVLIYFWFYFVFRLPNLDYKFGNTMPAYFFLFFKESPWQYWVLTVLIGFIFYALAKNNKRWLLAGFLLVFGWTSLLSIKNTVQTPRWVGDKYQVTLHEWQMFMANYEYSDIPLCIHKDGISSELYYLYHYLYPYQYLRPCSTYQKQRPKRIVTRKTSNFTLPALCNQEFKFSTQESIYYCPLGY